MKTLSLNAWTTFPRILHRTALAAIGVGLLTVFFSLLKNQVSPRPILTFLGFVLIALGSVLHFLHSFGHGKGGVRNNGIMFSGISARGAMAWVLGLFLTGFYCVLYWSPSLLQPLVRLADPLSEALRRKPADQYFLYGALYTFAILIMGTRALIKYRHIRYQLVRTASVMFFQFVFAFMLPSLLAYFREPEKYPSYFWPLSYKDLFPENVAGLMNHPGHLGRFLLLWSIGLTLIATPILTYYFGKRWYCSWVCGCGGLANTLGDPWRQLSDKSERAWKIERVTIYSVLGFIVITTFGLWLAHWTKNPSITEFALKTKMVYGFLIGMVFSGVVGTGFYPLMGTRVWCRFGCPQAAILGILQKTFSRFRITTNGAQCISCGNCSTYCEMGIDVRAYAQKGENIVRASCVGCGMCSAVCPRGVLNLENGPGEGRQNGSFSLVDELKS